MTRRERLERRQDRREAWADKARAESARRFGAATRIADGIPIGQPILVGHHSERHARRAQERIHANMVKGCEAQHCATRHAERAAGIGRQLDRSIFSDDADAIEELEKRAAEHDREANLAAEINKAWRKAKGTPAERAATLVAAGVMSEALAKRMQDTMALCPWLKAPLDSTNARAAARRDRQRIAELEARAVEDAGGVTAHKET